jgi:hypothetical protein
MTWFVRREASAPERPRLRLVCRKTNLTASLPDTRLQFDFGAERIAVSRIAISEEASEPVEANQSIPTRISGLIRAGGGQALTVAEIAERLGEKVESVARIIRRNGCFVKVPGDDGTPRIGLAARRAE